MQPWICISREKILHQYMPNIFKELEIWAESPSLLDMKPVCNSLYKGSTTMKGLGCLKHTGAVGFLSELYSGSASVKKLTKMSGVIGPWQWCNGRQRLQHTRWFCCNRGDCKCTLVSKEKLSSAEKKWNTTRKLSV